MNHSLSENKRKVTEPWKIALQHWFVAGFFIPLVAQIPTSLIYHFLGMSLAASETIDIFITSLIFYVAAAWYARILSKKYSIENEREVARLALYLFLITSGGARVYSFIFGLYSEMYVAMNYLIAIDIVSFICAAFIFYVTSKKYFRG